MTHYATRILAGLMLCFAASASHAAILTFNAATPADVNSVQQDWLAASTVMTPEYLVDFESGFIDGQNIHGVAGLLPGGLVISDSSPANAVTIEGASGAFGGSNPVGNFAIRHNERPWLVLDFALRPADYVGFQDIDQAGTSIRVTHLGGAISTFSIETTGAGGDSAEFTGIFRNDMPGITRIELDASGDGTWGLDNIAFGLTPVPLPGALALFAPAVLVLAGQRRRRAHGASEKATGLLIVESADRQ
ncbi:MAG: hypothetical protein WD928_10985 [Gammaproteobacteria bacterium]